MTGRTGTRQSLSARLLMVVLGMLVLVNTAYFVPSLRHERLHWLREHLAQARLVALALGASGGAMPPLAVRARIERLSSLRMIRELLPDGPHDLLGAVDRTMPTRSVDLNRETFLQGCWRGLEDLRAPPGGELAVTGPSADGPRLQVLVDQAPLARFLDRYASRFLTWSVTAGASVSLLLFLLLRALMVRPLLRITRSIEAFGADPEHATPLDAARVSVLRHGEIATVGQALSTMQSQLRAALWRSARLAAVGTAVAKMSHDLRGILSSALLVADRLTMSGDDPTRQAGEVIVRAVHRATALTQQTLEFVREAPAPLKRAAVRLVEVVDEAVAQLVDERGRGCRIDNRVGAEIEASIDRDRMVRVLTNLLRNACQAGARVVEITSAGEGAACALTVADDGPGLPPAMRAQVFRPFAPSTSGGSGLGLAIARDLMLAHGGDLTVASTGAEGTRFIVHLQQTRTA